MTHLNDSDCHYFSASVASKLRDINLAIIVNHLNYWINRNKNENKNFIEGKYWTYQTIKYIAEKYSYYSEHQVKRFLRKLIDKKVLIRRNFNKEKFDKTSWYTFTDEFKKFLDENEKTSKKNDGAKSNKRKNDNEINSAKYTIKETNLHHREDNAQDTDNEQFTKTTESHHDNSIPRSNKTAPPLQIVKSEDIANCVDLNKNSSFVGVITLDAEMLQALGYQQRTQNSDNEQRRCNIAKPIPYNSNNNVILHKCNITGRSAKTRSSHSAKNDFYFSHESKKFENISESDLDSFKQAYPEVNVAQEVSRAEQWLLSNPSKSNKKLWRKFLTGWLSRANDKAENRKAYQSQNGRPNNRFGVDRRTRDRYGNPVSSPIDNLF